MRIAIFGTGGVGGYFGGRLAEAGVDVTFVARGAHLEAVRETGLRVDSIHGDFVVHPAKAAADPGEVGEVDAVLVSTKSWQVPEAAAAMAPMMGSRTVVVPLLNGVEAPEQLAAVLGPDRVLGGVCGLIAFIAGPGHIRHVGIPPFLRFGELDNRRSPRAERLLETLSAMRGASVEIPDDIHRAMWQKFIFIASTSGVGALTRAPFGVVRETPETRALVEAAMTEAFHVGRARGVDLPDDAVAKGMAAFDAAPHGGTASMQRDIMAGRPSELGAQNGAVVRLGAAAGVETPVNGFICASLDLQERRARGELDFDG